MKTIEETVTHLLPNMQGDLQAKSNCTSCKNNYQNTLHHLDNIIKTSQSLENIRMAGREEPAIVTSSNEIIVMSQSEEVITTPELDIITLPSTDNDPSALTNLCNSLFLIGTRSYLLLNKSDEEQKKKIPTENDDEDDKTNHIEAGNKNSSDGLDCNIWAENELGKQRKDMTNPSLQNSATRSSLCKKASLTEIHAVPSDRADYGAYESEDIFPSSIKEIKFHTENMTISDPVTDSDQLDSRSSLCKKASLTEIHAVPYDGADCTAYESEDIFPSSIEEINVHLENMTISDPVTNSNQLDSRGPMHGKALPYAGNRANNAPCNQPEETSEYDPPYPAAKFLRPDVTPELQYLTVNKTTKAEQRSKTTEHNFLFGISGSVPPCGMAIQEPAYDYDNTMTVNSSLHQSSRNMSLASSINDGFRTTLSSNILVSPNTHHSQVAHSNNIGLNIPKNTTGCHSFPQFSSVYHQNLSHGMPDWPKNTNTLCSTAFLSFTDSFSTYAQLPPCQSQSYSSNFAIPQNSGHPLLMSSMSVAPRFETIIRNPTPQMPEVTHLSPEEHLECAIEYVLEDMKREEESVQQQIRQYCCIQNQLVPAADKNLFLTSDQNEFPTDSSHTSCTSSTTSDQASSLSPPSQLNYSPQNSPCPIVFPISSFTDNYGILSFNQLCNGSIFPPPNTSSVNQSQLWNHETDSGHNSQHLQFQSISPSCNGGPYWCKEILQKNPERHLNQTKFPEDPVLDLQGISIETSPAPATETQASPKQNSAFSNISSRVNNSLNNDNLKMNNVSSISSLDIGSSSSSPMSTLTELDTQNCELNDNWHQKKEDAEKKLESYDSSDLIKQDANGDSLLHMAMIHDDWPMADAILHRLIQDNLLKEVISTRNNLQQTPLCLAVICNRSNMVEILVENRADVNVHIKTFHDKLGAKFCSLLHLTSSRGHLWKETLKQLIKSEAIELDALNSDGKSPLHCAIEWHGRKLNDVIIDCKDTLRILAERGANLNQPDSGHEKTPLHYAIERRDVDLVSRLLVLASKFTPDRERSTVSQMLEARTGNGNTALHLAASVEMNIHEHKKLIQQLMCKGADPSVKNSDGCLPRELTRKREIVELLKGRTVSRKSPNSDKKRSS